MKTYDVHLYAVVRMKVVGIEAESQVDAIRLAEKEVTYEQRETLFNHSGGMTKLEYTEYAEEVIHYLVDEQGDEEYQNSRWYEANEIDLD